MNLKEKIKDFFDNPEEIFIWSMLQFPLYFILGWYVIPVQLLCGILGRLGGWKYGNKAFRRLGVPLTVCLATALTLHKLSILIAVPFMIWLCPSYGASGWLFKTCLKLTSNHKMADLLCRGITYIIYWTSFTLVLVFIK